MLKLFGRRSNKVESKIKGMIYNMYYRGITVAVRKPLDKMV